MNTIQAGLIGDNSILARPIDLVQPMTIESNTAYGIRYCPNMKREQWQCSLDVCNFLKGNVYAMFGTNEYVRLSPFIHIQDGEFYVYKSVTDLITGRTIYNKLFHTGTTVTHWPDFTKDRTNDGVRRTSQNGTVLNVYQENSRRYIDMGFKKVIRNFLIDDRSSVCAIVWGHGGVGKTATVQSVCKDLSLAEKCFDYKAYPSGSGSPTCCTGHLGGGIRHGRSSFRVSMGCP